MTDAIKEAYLNIERAMYEFNTLLERQVTAMRESEAADPIKLERMTQGAKAMRDSSAIYLSYTKLVAYQMPDSEEMLEESPRPPLTKLKTPSAISRTASSRAHLSSRQIFSMKWATSAWLTSRPMMAES